MLYRGFRRRTTGSFHVAIEGIDGSGKSTAVHAVVDLLRQEGLGVTEVAYGSKDRMVGRYIRWLYMPQPHRLKLLKAMRGARWLQELLYAFNARLNLARIPAADFVLADRSILSGFASHLDRLPMWYVSLCEPKHLPHLIVYLDIDESLCQSRVIARGGVGYEEDLASLKVFRAAYERLLASPPDVIRGCDIARVDGSSSKELVAQRIANLVIEKSTKYRTSAATMRD